MCPRPLCVPLLALAAWGCVADPLPTGEPVSDAAVDVDTAHPPDGGAPDADLRLDAAPDAAPPPDAGPDAAPVDGPPPAPDALPDLGPVGPEVDPPDFDEVAVTRRGNETFFVWIDAAGDIVRLRVDGEGQAGAPVVIDSPAERPDRLVALAVGGHPWVAYGGEESPVVLFQVDLPLFTRLELDGLRGPPLLARAGDGVLVIARETEGALAWLRVSNDLSQEPLHVDSLGLDVPDDAGGVPAGVVLVYDDAGQCVQLDDVDYEPAGNFVCPGSQMRLLSDGQRTLLSRIYRFGNDQRIGVKSLYDDDDDYLISFFELSSGTGFQNDGPRRPIVGARNFQGVRRLTASMIGPDTTWDTAQTWTDTSDWPFDTTRALAQRTLPSLARRGQCASGASCASAADCGDEECVGAVGAEHMLALEFRVDGRPRVRRYPLVRRAGVPASYGVPETAGCLPQVERCDLLDQDCDGRADDGRCCQSTANVSYRWQSVRPVARSMVDGAPRYDMLLTDVQTNNAYRMMYRFEGTDEWTGKTINLRQDPSGVPGNLGIRFLGAREGRFLVSAGGITGLVARAVNEDDSTGGWTLFMAHPSRREPGQFPPRPAVPLDCDRVLAVDALNHSSPGVGNESGEQILVVCPDKLIRVYAVHEGRDAVYRFDAYAVPTVSWATIARRGEADLEVMAGYAVPGEGLWAVRVLDVDGESDQAPELGLVPDQLGRIGPTAAAWPIHRHPVTGRPPIQIGPGTRARLAFDGFDARGDAVTIWRDAVLGPAPERVVFSPTEFRLYASGPVAPDAEHDEATGWWAVDVTGNQGIYDLWTTEPVFTIQGPIATWFATGGSYGTDDPLFDIGRYDVGIVYPTGGPDDHSSWRFVSRETRCIRP